MTTDGSPRKYPGASRGACRLRLAPLGPSPVTYDALRNFINARLRASKMLVFKLDFFNIGRRGKSQIGRDPQDCYHIPFVAFDGLEDSGLDLAPDPS